MYMVSSFSGGSWCLSMLKMFKILADFQSESIIWVGSVNFGCQHMDVWLSTMNGELNIEPFYPDWSILAVDFHISFNTSLPLLIFVQKPWTACSMTLATAVSNVNSANLAEWSTRGSGGRLYGIIRWLVLVPTEDLSNIITGCDTSYYFFHRIFGLVGAVIAW